MKGCLSLILLICVLVALFSALDKFGLFNENPEEVAEKINQEISEALEKTTTEEEVIAFFRNQNFYQDINSTNLIEDVKEHLNSQNYSTEEDFANDINKTQVLKSKLTVTLNKLKEINLSNEEGRQEIAKFLETELAFTNSLAEAIQSKINGGNWHESFAKAQMLRENLILLRLPEEFAEFFAEKFALYDKVKFFLLQSNLAKYNIAQVLQTENEQFNSEELSSENILSYDLQRVQFLRERIEIILNKTYETDFHYEVVKQKFIEASELEIAMTDNLTQAINAKLWGEDWQQALTETQNLIENYDAVYSELKKMEDNIKGGKNPETPSEEETVLVQNQKAEEKIRELAFTDADKEDVKIYLEETQPFVAVDYAKEFLDISTPLANNDPNKLWEYASAVANSANAYKGRNSQGIAKIREICKTYFATEAMIAIYYAELKTESGGNNFLDNLVGVVNKAQLISAAGDVKKLYELQSESEKEIQRLAEWSGADLYDSVTEAKFKITKNIFEKEFSR